MTLLRRYGLPPADIEALSLQRVDRAIGDLERWPVAERDIVRKLVYASGDPAIAGLVRFGHGVVDAALEALRHGCAIFVDVRMVDVAVDRPKATQLGCQIRCAVDDPAVIARAQRDGTTRAASAVHALAADLAGSVAVVGTAPTALLAILDLIDGGAPPPAAILGMPVGFVAASEAKVELMARAVPYVTIEGTRGGAGMAAATLNTLLAQAIETGRG